MTEDDCFVVVLRDLLQDASRPERLFRPCSGCVQFFRSVQSTCTELLKVIERYQLRITRESSSFMFCPSWRH